MEAVGAGEDKAWVELIEDQNFWIKKEKNEQKEWEGRTAKGDDSLDFSRKTLFVFALLFLSMRGLRCLWVFLSFVEEAMESH